jgi:hypothetical protein
LLAVHTISLANANVDEKIESEPSLLTKINAKMRPPLPPHPKSRALVVRNKVDLSQSDSREGRPSPSDPQPQRRINSFWTGGDDLEEVWPPKPPDLTSLVNSNKLEPKPIALGSSQIYRLREGRKVFKLRGSQREFDLMNAAGDLSVKAHGRVLYLDPTNGLVHTTGFIMDLETPLDPKTVGRDQYRPLMNQMISAVLALHKKGIVHGDIKPANMLICSDGKLRLCDFNEARRLDNPLDGKTWEGETTTNYLSPFRCRDWPDGSDPLPTIRDDLYALGLSIWELFTGMMPFDDVYMDDIMDTVKAGNTVDVDQVEDKEVREVIRKYLRCGGAKV